MIVNVACENYRSLERVEVPLSQMTALVGPNGAGKTTVLRALGLILADLWPSMRSVRVPQDFTRFDATLDLCVEVTFDPPLTHEDTLGNIHPVPGLRFTCKPYRRKTKKADVGDLHADFDPIGPTGDVPIVAVGRKADKTPDFKPLRVTNDLRDQSRVLFVDHRRSVLQHIPSMRGSALGRLFESARKELDEISPSGTSPRNRFSEAYATAMDALRTPRVQEVEHMIGETTKRMAGFLGGAALEGVDIGFGFADPANPLNSIRLVYTEGGLEIPAEELGLGIQSALVVGIFDALRKLGGPVGTLIIEEPEMYLHPQAQRYFYRLLTDMADGEECQVIYSTHAPIFADISRFESIRLVRKEPGSMSTVSAVASAEDRTYLEAQREAQKLLAFDASRSELLFARRVMLVEGPADRIAALEVASRLGHDPDAEDLAIVACGTKTAIPFFARVCSALDIPFVILHDSDIYPVEGDDTAKTQEGTELEKNATIAAGAIAGSVFLVEPTLEVALGIGRNAKDKPRRVFETLRERELKNIPAPLVQAVEALFSDS